MKETHEQITPKEAINEYLDSLIKNADSTVKNYGDHLKPFRQWCEDMDIASMSEMTGRHLHQYRLWREEQVKEVTLTYEERTLKRFFGFCENIGVATEGVADVLEPTNLDDEDKVDETSLEAGEAADIRSHLHGNAFATMPHVIFEIFWHTPLRLGGIRALDVDDFQTNRKHIPSMKEHLNGTDSADIECYLKIQDRPEMGTNLENDSDGERQTNLSTEVAEVIDAWIQLHHPMVKDDYGRMPLIGTKYGRASDSAIRENMYRVTRPCYYTDTCPHDRDQSCDARNSKEASKCPSSVSPHPIRRGSITYHLNSKWPKDKVSKRADVSREVLEAHYDVGTESDKRRRREQFLELL